MRTVRYYISQGLLPGPGGRGKAADYGDEHLARLRLIRRLSDRHVPLAEQRQQLAALAAHEVESLLHSEEAALDHQSQAPSPRAYVSGLLGRARVASSSPPQPIVASPARPPVEAQRWRRWQLAPGLELHAQADAAHIHARLIERLLEISREGEPNP